MKIRATKIIAGEKMPFGYGIAWHEYAEAAIVVYPMPFNFVARWVRSAYLHLMNQGAEYSKHYLAGYEKGYEEGKQHGIRKGRLLEQEELVEKISLWVTSTHKN